MKITCPACGFSRDVSRDRLPANSVIATCPKCGEKFKIKVIPADGNEKSDEEDIRQAASRAYQAEAERFAHVHDKSNDEEKLLKIGNPWELAPEPSGWTAAFFQTLSRVMFSATRFFASLPFSVSLLRPLLFYSIIILLQTVMDQLWAKFLISVLKPNAAGDPQLAKLLDLISTNNDFILSSLVRFGLMIFQLYLLALLLFVTYRIIVPKRCSFDLVFQVLAYSSAPAILCIVPVLGTLVGMIWSIGCFVIGIKTTLGLDWAKTLLGLLPLLFLLSPLLSAMFNLF